MTFDKLTLAIPAHWLCPIMYGDFTGLEDDDYEKFNKWLNDMTSEFGELAICRISDGTDFVRYHDAADYGVLACDCHDVDFVFHPVECAPA